MWIAFFYISQRKYFSIRKKMAENSKHFGKEWVPMNLILFFFLLIRWKKNKKIYIYFQVQLFFIMFFILLCIIFFLFIFKKEKKNQFISEYKTSNLAMSAPNRRLLPENYCFSFSFLFIVCYDFEMSGKLVFPKLILHSFSEFIVYS